MRPELADAGAVSSGIEHRHRAFEPPGGTLHPAGECRAVEMDALTGQDLRLPVQRQIPAELRDHHVGHECRRRHAAHDQPRQHLRMDHAIGAAAAAVFGTDRPQHAQDRRDHIQHLADVLADLVKQALATRARRRLRLQHLLTARQVLGQRADVAARLLARRLAKRLRRGIVVGAAGGVSPVSRSSSSSASCSATIAASRSERLPKIISLSVCIATRSFSFSAYQAQAPSRLALLDRSGECRGESP
jgi:hypothetical protein